MSFLKFIASSILVLAMAACDDFGASDEAGAAIEQAAPTLSAAQQTELLDLATAHLDNWQGDSSELRKAKEAINRVEAANPRNVRARIQNARHRILSGVEVGGVEQTSLDVASNQLRLALEIDPNAADAYSLLGHVRTLQKKPDEALELLAKARALGSEDPWLDRNLAAAYRQKGKFELAELHLRKMEDRLASGAARSSATRVDLARGWLDLHLAQEDHKAAVADYRRILELEPDSAWSHGNFGWFLLHRVGDTDAALVEARKALALMDYGNARELLAMALYAKWAVLAKSDEALAEQYFQEAQAILPDLEHVLAQALMDRQFNRDYEALVAILLDQGLSIDALDGDGETALFSASYLGYAESVRFLLRNGANVGWRNAAGTTPLGAAATRGQEEIVEILVGNGAFIDARNDFDRTALFHAAAQERESVVRKLIALGADVNAAAVGGDTPVLVAAETGNQAVVDLLLAAGADPTLAHPDYGDAAAMADRSGHPELARRIRAHVAAAAPGAGKK